MEQKRILWIVAAVGLFLLVVVGFALILYSPAQKQDPIITSNQSTNDIWSSPDNATPINPNRQVTSLQGTPLENVVTENAYQQGNFSQNLSSGQAIPEQNIFNQTNSISTVPNGNNVLPSDSMNLVGQQKVQDVTVISGTTKVITTGNTTIDVTGLTANSVSQPVVTQNTNTQTSTPKTVVASSTKTSTDNSAKNTSKAVSTTKSSSASTSTKTTSKSISTAKSASTTVTPKYWIQAGSYSSKKNAEEARSALSAEKIASEIFTFTDANGTLFYRVRVGPYTTKSEAEYWQSRIALIQKFSGTKTYITDSTAKKQ